ncbi:ribonuclease T2-like [Tulasnella sp. 332]|nr:ribonuclease T2-like [Tulasnella sp. 332]
MLSSTYAIALAAMLASAPVIARPVLHSDMARPATIFGKHQSTCSANLVSCSDSITDADSCCVETPGGQLVQVQFWDYKPSEGPADSWTIHGLWPDKLVLCLIRRTGGGYQENCDPSRAYHSITDVLKSNGKSDLVDYMKQFWVSNDESAEKFWEHEWSTHGTCMSTIAPACLASDAPQGLDAAYYFQRAVDTFKSLPTYTSLSAAGITPSTSKTYTLSELTHAGYIPAFDCKAKAISTVTYYYNLQGTVIDGTMMPFDAPKAGSCPSSGIKYPPKSDDKKSDGSMSTKASGVA